MFRTEIIIDPSPAKIELKSPILTVGSCFSDNIGKLLSAYKFEVLTNPFGVIFNPINIDNLLGHAIEQEPLHENGWVYSQGIHYHYDVHSQLGDLDKNKAIAKTKQVIDKVNMSLTKIDWLIITWGTAVVYERNDTGEIVANCHKIPTNQFTKRLLSVEDIINSFEKLMAQLPENLNILLTVSPVRHLRETLTANSVSKSTLRVAVHILERQYEQVTYFPAYELLLDDLRDYRFYQPDMLHPSEEAIQYIWDKFTQCYFDNETMSFVEKWTKIINALNHKPFHPDSAAHQQFIRNTIAQLEKLNHKVNTRKELIALKRQLIHA